MIIWSIRGDECLRSPPGNDNQVFQGFFPYPTSITTVTSSAIFFLQPMTGRLPHWMAGISQCKHVNHTVWKLIAQLHELEIWASWQVNLWSFYWVIWHLKPFFVNLPFNGWYDVWSHSSSTVVVVGWYHISVQSSSTVVVVGWYHISIQSSSIVMTPTKLSLVG